LLTDRDEISNLHSEITDTSSQTIPVVGLLIQGSPRGLDLVLFYLRNKMPVVVVKGTGGCADLLAYALEEAVSEKIF
jgi:hypothetical protein